MTTCKLALATALSWGLLTPTLWALPTAEELLKKVEAKVAGLKSFEVDIEGTDADEERMMEFSEHMVLERFEKEGKTRTRSFIGRKRSYRYPNGGEGKEESKVVNDGEIVWTESHYNGSKGKEFRVTKARAGDEDWALDVLSLTGEDLKNYSLQVVGEKTVDGTKVYVLKGIWRWERITAWDVGTGKEPKGNDGTLEVWVGQDDLMLRSWLVMATMPGGDKPYVLAERYRNIRLNEKVAPETFRYTPPEGVDVEDSTRDQGKRPDEAKREP